MTSRAQSRSRTPLIIPDVNQDTGDGGRESVSLGTGRGVGSWLQRRASPELGMWTQEGASQRPVHPTSSAMLLTWMQGVPRGSLGAI